MIRFEFVGLYGYFGFRLPIIRLKIPEIPKDVSLVVKDDTEYKYPIEVKTEEIEYVPKEHVKKCFEILSDLLNAKCLKVIDEKIIEKYATHEICENPHTLCFSKHDVVMILDKFFNDIHYFSDHRLYDSYDILYKEEKLLKELKGRLESSEGIERRIRECEKRIKEKKEYLHILEGRREQDRSSV